MPVLAAIFVTIHRRRKLFNIGWVGWGGGWGANPARPTSILGGDCKADIHPTKMGKDFVLFILLPKSYLKLHTFIHMRH